MAVLEVQTTRLSVAILHHAVATCVALEVLLVVVRASKAGRTALQVVVLAVVLLQDDKPKNALKAIEKQML